MVSLPSGWSPKVPSSNVNKSKQILFQGKLISRCPKGYVKDDQARTCVRPEDLKKEQDEYKKIISMSSGEVFYNQSTGQTIKKLNNGYELSDFEQDLMKKYGNEIEAINDKAILYKGKFTINISKTGYLLNDKQQLDIALKVKKMHKDGIMNNGISPETLLVSDSKVNLNDFSASEKITNKNKSFLAKDIVNLSSMITGKASQTRYGSLLKKTAKEITENKDNKDKISNAVTNYLNNI